MNALELAWRNLRWRSIASWLSVSTVALGIALVTILQSLPSALTPKSLTASAPLTIVASKNSSSRIALGVGSLEPPVLETIPHSVWPQVRSLPGVFVAAPMRITHSNNGPLVLVTRAYFQLNAGRLHLAEGRFFETDEVGTAVIGFGVATQQKVSLGESLEHGGVRFKVVGILAEAGEYFDSAVFSALYGEQPISAVLFSTENSFDISTAREVLSPLSVISVDEALHRVGQLLGALDEVVAGLSAGLALVIAFLVFAAFYTGLRERTRDLAILRAVGVRQRTLLFVLFFEALLIGGAGVFFGLVAADVALKAASSLFAQAGYLFAPDISSVSLLIGVRGMIATLVAGLIPALSVYRIDPLQGMSGVHRPWSELLGRRGKTIFRWVKFFIVWFLVVILPSASFRESPKSREINIESQRIFTLLESWDGVSDIPADFDNLQGKNIELEGYLYVPVEPFTPEWRSRFFLVARDPNQPTEVFHDDHENSFEENQKILIELQEPIEATLYPIIVKGNLTITKKSKDTNSIYYIKNANAKIIAIQGD